MLDAGLDLLLVVAAVTPRAVGQPPKQTGSVGQGQAWTVGLDPGLGQAEFAPGGEIVKTTTMVPVADPSAYEPPSPLCSHPILPRVQDWGS